MVNHQHTLSRIVREKWLGNEELVPDIASPDFAAVLGRVVLGEVIGEVLRPRSPRDRIFATCHSVADPVVAHVDGFGTLEMDRVVGEANGSRVVGDYGGGGLRVAEVCKSEA